MLQLSNFLNIKKYFLFYTSQTIPKTGLRVIWSQSQTISWITSLSKYHIPVAGSLSASLLQSWNLLSWRSCERDRISFIYRREPTCALMHAAHGIQNTWNRIAWKSVFVQESVRHGKGSACSRTPGGAFTLCQSHSPHSARKTDLPFKSLSGPKGGSGLCYRTVWQHTVASQLLFLPRNTHTCLL